MRHASVSVGHASVSVWVSVDNASVIAPQSGAPAARPVGRKGGKRVRVLSVAQGFGIATSHMRVAIGDS